MKSIPLRTTILILLLLMPWTVDCRPQSENHSNTSCEINIDFEKGTKEFPIGQKFTPESIRAYGFTKLEMGDDFLEGSGLRNFYHNGTKTILIAYSDEDVLVHVSIEAKEDVCFRGQLIRDHNPYAFYEALQQAGASIPIQDADEIRDGFRVPGPRVEIRVVTENDSIQRILVSEYVE